jgi:hypothetical protein
VHKLIILAIIVAAVGWAEAATYYVDSDDGRNDPSQSGGPLDPWRTITYALSCVSGENTFMCRGTFEEEIWVAYDDRRSEFTANPEATLVGWLECDYETGVDLNGFRVYGYAAGGSKSGISATDCYFNNPKGRALGIHRFYGGAWAENCIIEDCASVCGASGWEFGRLAFSDCEIRDCGRGISVGGEATTSLTRCRFSNVGGTVFSGFFYGEGASFRSCEFYDCENVIFLRGSITHGYWGHIEDSTFRGNAGVITVEKEGDWGTVDISGNLIIDNKGTAMTLGGKGIELRRNIVKDNGGYGVFITEGAPDLGTPGDPGGNTFAGNQAGRDVFNASPENIPAYGNTWDPQSEAEMAGKTWQEVNVTRICDHWDNPDAGYVMWSEPMLGVAPASLGQIKASFKGAPSALRRPAKGTDAAK